VYLKKFSISDKLIITSLLTSILTISIIASYSFFNAKDAILERTFNQLTSVRVVKTNLVKEFFNNRFNELKLVRVSSDTQQLVKKINSLDSSTNYTFIKDSLICINNIFIKEIAKDYYESIQIVGKNKKIFSIKSANCNNPIDYQKIWKTINNNDSVFINDLQKDKNNNAYFTLYSNIKNQKNQTIGYIICKIPISAINTIMLEKGPSNGLGNSGESYLVGKDFLMRSASRFQKNSVLKTTVRTQAIKFAIKDSTGNAIINDYRNIPVLSSYSQLNIQNLHWFILAEIDYKEVVIPIYKIRNEIIFISIFIFLIILVIIIIFSKKITSPLQNLNQAAQEIGTGNLNINIPVYSDDEIGKLTNTFNQMVEKLRRQKEELKIEKDKNLRSLIDGQELERQRLSIELHDSLGQLLIGLKLKYEHCRNQFNINDDFSNDLSLLFDKTIEETRRISNNLMPAALSEFGLITAVRNIGNIITELTNIQFHISVEGDSQLQNDDYQIYIFRIIQEGLTNIVKHAEAKKASLELFFNKNQIKIIIQDNGIGFNKNEIDILNSKGLSNIKNRILLLSGELNIQSEKGKGTIITAQIPYLNSNL